MSEKHPVQHFTANEAIALSSEKNKNKPTTNCSIAKSGKIWHTSFGLLEKGDLSENDFIYILSSPTYTRVDKLTQFLPCRKGHKMMIALR